MRQQSSVRILVECALMIALSTILSFITIYQMPQGGDVTLAATLPLMLASHRHGLKWGLFTGFTHSLLQTLFGLKNVMYCPTLATMAGCVLLDYVIAYTVVGAFCAIEKPFANRRLGTAAAAATVGLLRYLCSFLSGILIWGAYAPEDMPVWLYSLGYNGSYMIPEIILTTLAAVLLFPLLEDR